MQNKNDQIQMYTSSYVPYTRNQETKKKQNTKQNTDKYRINK